MNKELLNLLVYGILWPLLAICVFYWLNRLSKWVRALSKAFFEVKERVDCMQAANEAKSYINAKMALQELRALKNPTPEDYDAINKAEQHIAQFEEKYDVVNKDF